MSDRIREQARSHKGIAFALGAFAFCIRRVVDLGQVTPQAESLERLHLVLFLKHIPVSYTHLTLPTKRIV